jgi:hypothetical protein
VGRCAAREGATRSGLSPACMCKASRRRVTSARGVAGHPGQETAACASHTNEMYALSAVSHPWLDSPADVRAHLRAHCLASSIVGWVARAGEPIGELGEGRVVGSSEWGLREHVAGCRASNTAGLAQQPASSPQQPHWQSLKLAHNLQQDISTPVGVLTGLPMSGLGAGWGLLGSGGHCCREPAVHRKGAYP